MVAKWRQVQRTSAFSLCAIIAGCGGRSSAVDPALEPVPHCVPGLQAACGCTDGSTGAQICKNDGSFGPCSCEAAAPGTGGSLATGGSGGTFGGGSGGTFGGGSGGTFGGGSGGTFGGGFGGTVTAGTNQGGAGGKVGEGGTVINHGPSKLIDVFVGELGVYVVLSSEIALVDRDGSDIVRVTLPRDATAAAFDGERLVVADRAKLTAFDPKLEVLGSGELIENCASAVMISDARFVCGPENDWDRIFYTYDTDSFELIASSSTYTYHGIPMKRVPGTDDFVTVTVGSSPSDFHLYTVTATGEPRFVNESPYHGDFRVTGVYAFDAEPPSHLVTDTGLLLSVYNETCSTETSSFTSGCFVKDGELGTLTGDQVFIGMEGDGAGTIYALTQPAGLSYSPDLACVEQACLAQIIDVAGRSIREQKVFRAEGGVGAIVALRPDPFTGGMVVGYRTGERFPLSWEPYPGHRVERIEFP